MKAVVAAFNQEKALVGAFSVITNLRMELFEALHSTAACGYEYWSCTRVIWGEKFITADILPGQDCPPRTWQTVTRCAKLSPPTIDDWVTSNNSSALKGLYFLPVWWSAGCQCGHLRWILASPQCPGAVTDRPATSSLSSGWSPWPHQPSRYCRYCRYSHQ